MCQGWDKFKEMAPATGYDGREPKRPVILSDEELADRLALSAPRIAELRAAVNFLSPVVEGAKVEGKVVSQVKSAKVVVYKYKAKKNERKKQGHRQPYTKVEITAING